MSVGRQFVSRAESRKVFITSKSTTNFRHLLPVAKPKHIIPKNSLDRRPDSVKPKERIKWWNIVPGDQVRVMAEESQSLREVKGVNKFTNRVFIEGDKNHRPELAKDDIRNLFQTRNPHKNVHYSGLQLFMGNFDFPPLPGSTDPRNLPVFATRLGASEKRWEKGRWIWDRFATATSPRLPSWTSGTKEHISIPWPEPEKPNVPSATAYDTPPDVVAEVTYEPSKVPRKVKSEALELPESKADDYVRMLRKEAQYLQSFPMEQFVARELSNPHSREKKRQRYLAAKAKQRALLKTFLGVELSKRIEGRGRREAVAEATYKWQERMRLDRKAELKKRWIARGLQARLERRRRRAAEKQESEKKKLRELILREAPNQVVPRS